MNVLNSAGGSVSAGTRAWTSTARAGGLWLFQWTSASRFVPIAPSPSSSERSAKNDRPAEQDDQDHARMRPRLLAVVAAYGCSGARGDGVLLQVRTGSGGQVDGSRRR